MAATTAATTRWPTQPTQWTRDHDKLFERALLLVPEDLPDRWEKIAEQVPGKSAAEIRDHYEALVHDILEIDSGRVEVPSYSDESAVSGGGLAEWDSSNQISFGSKPRHGGDNERKKGTPWTEEEHRYIKILKDFTSIQFRFFFSFFPGLGVLIFFWFFIYFFLFRITFWNWMP